MEQGIKRVGKVEDKPVEILAGNAGFVGAVPLWRAMINLEKPLVATEYRGKEGECGGRQPTSMKGDIWCVLG